MTLIRILATGVLAVLFAVFIPSCGSDSSGGGVGDINLVMTSADLARSENRPGSSYSVTYSRTTDIGLCYTPLSVKGIFNMATLGKTGGGAPARLLGGGSLVGLEGIFHHGAFDLESSPTIEGEDNLEDTAGPYNIVSLSLQAIEYSFQADTGGQYYHVRIPFVWPKPSDDSVFSGCGLGSGPLAEADGFGTFWDGMAAQPSDILVCIKAGPTDACTDAEYQWVNTNALVSSRPVSPKQVVDSGYLLTDSQCSSSGGNTDWGYSSFDVGLSSSVDVTAAINSGTKTYTVGSSSGTVLTATIDFDLTNSLFVPSSSLSFDLASANQAQVLGNIDKILPKPLYVRSLKTNASSDSDSMFTATATLTVQ